MGVINVTGSNLGNSLTQLLMADEIVPGESPSYETCKTLFLYHPLGAKMAEAPVTMAQSQPREITIADGPEDMLREAFETEWRELGADGHIHNARKTARIYGLSTLALVSEGTPPSRPIDFKALAGSDIGFNVLDPLNTSGSNTLNQNPNAADFQKTSGTVVQGSVYHRSRVVVTFNEKPIYLGYSVSAFGYVGRSVYQRALFPMKSFVQTMRTDDLVVRKAGLLIAKLKQAGSVINNVMNTAMGLKRNIVKEAQTGDVISISTEEAIDSLNLQNLEGPLSASRKNILENIATAADMPAKILNQETFAAGFGEGTEDAKSVARYVDHEREEMQHLYAFFDKICQFRAWNPEFYKTVQAKYPERYGNVAYTVAFYQWLNSFKAIWPNLLKEPDSEKVKVDESRSKAAIGLVEVLLPNCDPDNKAALFQWLADVISEQKTLFQTPLVLDYESMANYTPPTPPVAAIGDDKEPSPPKPEAY